MDKDPLEYLPMNKWPELQAAFKSDWPRCIQGYATLDFQRQLTEQGLDYGFTVYCPYGDVWNGMVALNKKGTFYEVMIVCPRDDTTDLQMALRETKVIDWNQHIAVPFVAEHINKCIAKIIHDVGVEVDLDCSSGLDMFVYPKDRPLFHISLPPEFSVDVLRHEHIQLLDSTWPHRYPGSEGYFKILIDSKSGLGLFKNEELIAWCLIKENGALGHLYTVESYRRKGYGEIMLKLICNVQVKANKDAFAYCIEGNRVAYQLYEKLAFEKHSDLSFWCLKPKTNCKNAD